MRDIRRFLRQSILAEVVIVSVIISFLLAPQLVLRAEDDPAHGMHDGMSIPLDSSVDSATQAALGAWKRESSALDCWSPCMAKLFSRFRRFPAHFQRHRTLALRRAELVVRTDASHGSLAAQGIRVLLLAVGVIELQPARGVLKTRWSGWVFPLVASAGSLILLSHDHQAGMTVPNHMELMHRIQSQHVSFSVTGLGIALSKGLAETPFEWRPFFDRLYPTLLVVLGALLMVYVE
jgi:hypothetical protein